MEDTLEKLQDAFFKADKAVQDQRKNNFKNVDLSKLEGIREGLKAAIDIYENTERKYKVSRHTPGSGSRTIKKNLTRKEAQQIVGKDIKENPKAIGGMLTFDKM